MKYLTPVGRIVGGGELPLEPGGEARSPAAAQPGGEHFLETCCRRHARQDLVEGLVAVGLQVVLDLLGVDDAHVAQDQLLLPVEERVVLGGTFVRADDPLLDDLATQDVLLDDLVHHGRSHLAVGDLAAGAVLAHVDLHQRVHGAQSLAARAGDRGAAPGARVLARPDDRQHVGLRQFLLEGLEDLAAARRDAPGAQADADVDVGDP